MKWFSRSKKREDKFLRHYRAPSHIAPGLTRTDLVRKLEPFVSLAAAEPPPVPTPKKSDVSPNTIWQLWWQGEASAPPAVRTCLDSVCRHAGSRPVVLLDSRNVHEYLDIPRFLLDKHAAGGLKTALLTDYIRMALLSRYGGTWIDATVWVSGDIPPKALESEFFIFSSPYWTVNESELFSPDLLGVLRFMSDRPSATLCGSIWWISARPGALPVRVMERLLEAYWKGNERDIDYVLTYDLLSLAILVNPRCREIWRRMPKYCTTDAQMLMSVLLEPYDERMVNAILARTTIHKMTHRIPADVVRPDTVYRRIFAD